MSKEKIRQAIIKFYRENKGEPEKFPRLSWLSRETGLSIEEVKNTLLQFNQIRKYQTNYYYSKDFIAEIKKEGEKNTVQNKIIAPVKNFISGASKSISETKFSMKIIVQLVCLFVSAGCIYVTSSLSFDWAFGQLGNDLQARILSIAIPLYSSFMPEGIGLLRRARVHWSIIGVLILTIIFAMGFDGFAIFTGQYNKRFSEVKTESAEQNTINRDAEKMKILIEQKTAKEENKSEKELQIIEEKKILSEMSPKEKENNSWLYRSQKNKVDNLIKEREAIEKEIDAIENKRLALLENGKIVLNTADNITGMENAVNVTEFYMLIILAVFLVLIEPLGVYVGLGLWQNKQEIGK